MRRLLALLASLALLSLPFAAVAEARHDAALWLVSRADVPLDDRFSFHFMLQNRWTDDVGRYQRTVLRPWLGIALPAGFDLALGYDAHIFDNPEAFTEHRAWQRVTYRRPFDGFRLFSYFWLEERFFPRGSVAWRGRFGVGGEVDLPRKLELVVQNDFMVDLNETSVIRSTGLGENQLLVGLRRPLGSWLRLELGYLVQYLDRPGPDLFNHTVVLSFAVRTPRLFGPPPR